MYNKYKKKLSYFDSEGIKSHAYKSTVGNLKKVALNWVQSRTGRILKKASYLKSSRWVKKEPKGRTNSL